MRYSRERPQLRPRAWRIRQAVRAVGESLELAVNPTASKKTGRTIMGGMAFWKSVKEIVNGEGCESPGLCCPDLVVRCER